MTRALSAIAALTLLVLTLLLFKPAVPAGELGLCFPSPNEWHLPVPWGWVLDTLFIFASALLLAATDKTTNFLPESHGEASAALLLLAACNALTTVSLSTSTLLLLFNAFSLYVILSCYEERNAARQFFILASMASIGSMVQYAFLLLVPVYIIGGIVMKSFRLRELMAYLMGLAAPYWIVLGLGIVPVDSLRLPGSLDIFKASAVDTDIFFTLLGLGAMTLIGFILSLYNGVRLFSRNSRLRCTHMVVNIMGYAAVLGAIFDFNNFTAYYGMVALWVAVNVSALISFYEIRRRAIVLLLLFLLFLPLYILG